MLNDAFDEKEIYVTVTTEGQINLVRFGPS